MKSVKKSKPIFLSMVVALSILSLSFSSNKGGEGFEIYLDSKLVLQQFGNDMNAVRSISIDNSLSNARIVVKYFHCGKPGKNRMISVRDDNNRVLKEWHYPDVSLSNMLTGELAMNLNVADLLNLQHSTNNRLSLYYSSGELPKGRVLATLVMTGTKAVRR